MFSGKRSVYHEWTSNLIVYLRLSDDKRIDEWMVWAQTQKEETTDDAARLAFKEGSSYVTN